MSGEGQRASRSDRVLLDDAIARLALLAAAERDVQRVLDRAVACIANALAVEHVQLFELLPDDVTLVTRTALDYTRDLTGIEPDSASASQAGYTLRARAPVVAEDLARETRFRPSRTQQSIGVVASVGVPLIGRGARPFGVLEIGARDRLPVPTHVVVDFLQSAGHLIVAAVERARVEAACRFLAESESRLVSAHDFGGTVRALAEMAIPQLADWCCIDVVLPNGRVECVAVAHTEPAVTPLATELLSRFELDPTASSGVARVIRTGLSEFHSDLRAARPVGERAEEWLVELADTAGFGAAIVAPLAARGHVLGAVTLVATKGRRLFDRGDVMLAEAFAAHASLALDNVRLFFGSDEGTADPPRLAGGAQGIVLLDSQVVGTRLLSALADERARFERVVESVVLASRLSRTDERLGDETCDAVEVVRGTIESVRGSLPSAWSLELDQPSVHVAGDAETLRRIVTVLVDNAVTYSPDGGAVGVRLEVGKSSIRLVVEDEGVGIAESDRELVFEKFHRGAGAERAEGGGAGLGLFICRELVDRLHGRIDIGDREQGTTITVELPLAAVPASAETLPAQAGGRRVERPI